MDSDVTAASVVERHLAAVASGDPDSMAVDYADDAVLVRGGEVHRGRDAITMYFRTVPGRLGGGHVEFDGTTICGDTVVFWWRIVGGPSDGVSGHDTCTVRDDRIVSQQVHLDTDDF